MRTRATKTGGLVAAGMLLACLYGVGLLVNWWTGVIFPGTQFFYSSNGTQPRIFRLTGNGTNNVARVRIPADYISALFPGPHWRHSSIEFDVYLPDMVPERIYDENDAVAAKMSPDDPPDKLLDQLDVSLSVDFSKPTDPSTKLGFVTCNTSYVLAHYRHLKDNPYPAYNAYICGPEGETAIDGGSDTETFYLPKDGSQFYVFCSGEGGLDVMCSVLFVYKKIIDVYVDIAPQNIRKAAYIIQKLNAFLSLATNFVKPASAIVYEEK